MRLILCLSILAFSAAAQDTLAPTENISTDGIPPVPAELATKIDRYGNYRSASFAQWHPERLEMLINTRFGDTNQVHRVTAPMGMREQLTFFDEPIMGVGDYVNGESFTIRMDTGGNEFFQLYRFDPASGDHTLLTDGKSRNTGGLRSETTGQIVFQRVDADANGAFTEFFITDPLKSETTRKVATMRGGGWGATDWSPDGKQLLLNEYISISNSRIWLLDVETGESKKLLPRDDNAEISYSGGQFEPKGRWFYTTTNENSEFMQLRSYRFDDLSSETFTEKVPWDIEDFDLAPDGKAMAYLANVAGSSSLSVFSLGKEDVVMGPSGGVPGVMGNLKWHNDSRHLAFTHTRADRLANVFVIDTQGVHTPVQWTNSESAIPVENIAETKTITWKSFDGLELSGFLYSPPAKFTGLRPVVVIIHGGPEGQSRPGFLGRWNYFLNELGIAIIYPNVRGSTGYGKTFANLDNGNLREGTYKDIGALLDWIGEQPNLDPSRIMIYGGSYGGHMTLATATRYSDKIACSVNLFGISNLRTFLENTQGYRRDLRRAEYGDERDPELRAWMDATAPMAHVNSIRKPMLVQQGANDPRVPQSESDQIVAALKSTGTPVWYLLFADEGHGFLKKPNADFAFYTTALFAQQYLLNE